MYENNKIKLTSEGLNNMKERLKHLIDVDRPKNVIALKEARAQGDLSENAEYDAARDEQAHIEAEILELTDIINNATIIDEDNSTSNVGKIVSIKYTDTSEIEEFLLVDSSIEANPLEGKISKESPLGKAIYEANKGDKVLVKPENGDDFYVIIMDIKER